MKLAEMWSGVLRKRINRKDFIIAVQAFLLIAVIFFGWYYFVARENPLDVNISAPEAKYRYLFSIYNPENLSRPLGVAVSAWGDVFVTDSLNHRIAVFDRNGKLKKTLGKSGSGPGEFNYPSGIAISGNKVFVADFYNQRVQALDPDGKHLNFIPAARDRRKIGPAVMPITVAADSKGNLYVSDLSVQRILVFDENGNFLRQFGKAGANPGELSYVNGIAVDDTGEGIIYLSNSNNGRVDEYSMDGTFIRTLPGSKHLTNPKGIAFDRAIQRIYAADTFAHQVTGLNKQGNVFETLGKRGIDAGGFNFPNDVAADGKGRLYVADRENNRVEVYTRE